MKVTVAKSAGFCFGVERAVDMVASCLQKGEKVATFGPIINNNQLVAELEAAGCHTVTTLEELPEGCKLILRSHGVLKNVEEALAEKGTPYLDATCPFVKRVQRLAAEEAGEGGILLLAGDPAHPEVKAIYSYTTAPAYIFKNSEELAQTLQNLGNLDKLRFVLLAQTTFHIEEWKKCVEIVKNQCTNHKIFDTICNATSLRQNESILLAQSNDLMVVVGGRHSSNTAKLYEICKAYTRTVWVETANELCTQDFTGVKSVGITAGASTPVSIIKEVQTTMNELLNDNLSFEEMLELSFKNTYMGEKVTAVVTHVAPNEITVDIGTKQTGYVPVSEFTDDPLVKIEELVKPGDTLELQVIRINDVEGTVMLSKKRLDAAAGFEKVMSAAETGEVLSGVVTEVIKGGVLALTNGVKVFIPASQATASRGQELESLLKTKVEFVILETNRQRRRAVGSIRSVLGQKRKEMEESFWQTAEEFKDYTGTVKSLTSYAAFVDLGGVDGMLHISELSWAKLKHPSQVVSVGDTVEVFIKELDRENKKIALGYKGKGENPWDAFLNEYAEGSVTRAKIVMLTAFGAFAQIVPGVDGLIHISQISLDRIKHPGDVLKVGNEVDVKILEIDSEKKRISLSIKALLEPETSAEAEEVAPETYEAAPPATEE